MSEEILKALTQLFAIITKQDGGVTENERKFVISFFEQELDRASVKEYIDLYDQSVEYNKEKRKEKTDPNKWKLTSVRDSVKTLAFCKQINKTLTQKQKVVVLIKILELVSTDQKFTPQRMEIIDTISTVFNIVKGEYQLIESFVLKNQGKDMPYEDILVANFENGLEGVENIKHVHAHIHGEAIFLRVASTDMYFTKYHGKEEMVLNGFIMKPGAAYLFSPGSTLKSPGGEALYYSDIIRNYLEEIKATRVSFNADNLEYRFSNGTIGLQKVNISEGPGKLIGIMGVSGAGKTTLINVLSGVNSTSSGEVLINGIDVHKESEKISGVIGYVSQDDLLIEELTVYENLFYNAKLCFDQLSRDEIHTRVMAVLKNLGLDQRKDLKVGGALEKTISGGQRKRLNIALELIREPAVLFVDEPTSGLSSRDSENVIDLLKELSLRGKLIFVVIHQPSSDIYKMFDKVYLMDNGGYPVFYGNPVEAVTYFKGVSKQVDAERGQCPVCGNVNPEQIFNIIEAQVVDEYGEYTSKRKIGAEQWNELFEKNFKIARVPDEKVSPPTTLNIPSRLKQIFIFTARDYLAKISNRQYLIVNLIEAPILALLLAFIIRYNSSPDHSGYIFSFNDNFPVYIMMSLIVALFMGLTVSAEEIIRDAKILKRESFLHLSWNSYLLSKVIILFSISAVQTFTFIIIGNAILEVKGMNFSFWLILFSISCFSNILGLNISSAFKSAVTVYVLIPLLIVPQMILNGLLFDFDKLNDLISTKGRVPIIADLMASRWGFEALAVEQFKNNGYQKYFYEFEKQERQSDYYLAHWVPEIRDRIEYIEANYQTPDQERLVKVERGLEVVRNELIKAEARFEKIAIDYSILELPQLDPTILSTIQEFLTKYEEQLRDDFNQASHKKEQAMNILENYGVDLNLLKDEFYNVSLAELVRNIATKERILEYKGELYQQIDPIFREPRISGIFNYRTHYYAPKKNFGGIAADTYYFNLGVIWFMTILLYIALYYRALRIIVIKVGKLGF